MANVATCMSQGHATLVPDTSEEEVTLVRFLGSLAIVHGEPEEPEVVTIHDDEVFDDTDESSGIFVRSQDQSFLDAINGDGPAIFGPEVTRRIKAILDYLREIDFAFPGVPGGATRHAIEGHWRRKLLDGASLDAGW